MKRHHCVKYAEHHPHGDIQETLKNEKRNSKRGDSREDQKPASVSKKEVRKDLVVGRRSLTLLLMLSSAAAVGGLLGV